MKKRFLSLLLPAFGILPVVAQVESKSLQVKKVSVADTYWEDAADENSRVLETYKFMDNWFLGVQVGDMMSWGSSTKYAEKWADKQNMALSAHIGKWVAPWMGFRVSAFYGHNSGFLQDPNTRYTWLTYGGTYDMLLNFSSLFFRYKESRKFDVIGILGEGLTHTTDYSVKDERVTPAGKNFLAARIGLQFQYNINRKWEFHVEVTNNWINSKFDGQDLSNRYDGYVNVVAGVTFHLRNRDGSRNFSFAKYNSSRYDLMGSQSNVASSSLVNDNTNQSLVKLDKLELSDKLNYFIVSFDEGAEDIEALQQINVHNAAEKYKAMKEPLIYIIPYADGRVHDLRSFSKHANMIKAQLRDDHFVPAGTIIIEKNPTILKHVDTDSAIVILVNN